MQNCASIRATFDAGPGVGKTSFRPEPHAHGELNKGIHRRRFRIFVTSHRDPAWLLSGNPLPKKFLVTGKESMKTKVALAALLLVACVGLASTRRRSVEHQRLSR